jgi:hypothetical protein
MSFQWQGPQRWKVAPGGRGVPQPAQLVRSRGPIMVLAVGTGLSSSGPKTASMMEWMWSKRFTAGQSAGR